MIHGLISHPVMSAVTGERQNRSLFFIQQFSARDHCKYDSYRRFNALKQKNPALKTFLSIGGWNSGSEQWSEMASDPARRQTFVDSVIRFVDTFGWDGIDFDWEYPGDR